MPLPASTRAATAAVRVPEHAVVRVEPAPGPSLDPSPESATPTSRAGGASPQPDTRVPTQAARLRAILSFTDKLNFGCGDHPLPGWCNLDNGDGVWYRPPEHPDIVQLDVFEALHALPRSCASFITSEHFFEHFTLEEGRRILRGWLLALRPGGVVRVVTPDLETEARIYLHKQRPVADEIYLAHKRRWLNTRHTPVEGELLNDCILLNYGVRLDGHKMIYDFDTLAHEMRLAGFTNVRRCAYRESSHAELRDIDHHDGGDTGRSFVPGLALVVEGSRPTSIGPAAGQLNERHLQAAEESLTRMPRSCAPDIDPATRCAIAELAALRRERAAMRARLIEAVAERCAAEGFRNIALFGAGQHTRRMIREPWASKGVRVACVFDDAPKVSEIEGVPVLCPPAPIQAPEVRTSRTQAARAVLPAFDAVVVSSDAHERVLSERARRVFGVEGASGRGVPVLEIYGRAQGGLHLG